MTNFSYDIVRSPKRRKLRITVERDRAVVVRAPVNATDGEIARVVNAKRQWILEKLRHPQKYRNRQHPPGKEVVNGESAPYLGRDYRIEIVDTPSGKVEFDYEFRVPPNQRTNRRKVLRNWYMAQAKEKILQRAAQYARSLGVEFEAVRIVDNRYRWGSCTVKNNINFNWRLIKAPMFVIDYVIVHELAHLMEANHTDRFWGIVRTHAPAAEKATNWLREHGQMLEDEV
jgi:predicted metal-dependent hydrolase